MRGEFLKELIHPAKFDVVDINAPIRKTFPLFVSLGWRFKVGPLISAINNYLKESIKGNDRYDLVWIDKGVFIDPAILKKLKRKDNILVHFTPDTAFLHNRSRLFYEALPVYDYCVTTKSFEIGIYQKHGVRNLFFCTQGFDPGIHHGYHEFRQKEGIAFIGKHDSWREEIIERLLEENLEIKLAGADWTHFAKKNKQRNNLKYYGEGLFGEDYAKIISGSLIGLGLLVKKFPEKHTTRSFEIPACGTALATERNEETESYYKNDEVIFFSGLPELTEKVKMAIADPVSLEGLSRRGHQAVVSGGYDYKSILHSLLEQMHLLK
jgi:spore maturation protein CgeB